MCVRSFFLATWVGVTQAPLSYGNNKMSLTVSQTHTLNCCSGTFGEGEGLLGHIASARTQVQC